MNILVLLIILTVASLSTSAPTDHLQQFELSMLNKLHQPWFMPGRRSEYPLKGEYPCKGGICRTKPNAVNECEDCQVAKPLEWEKKK